MKKPIESLHTDIINNPEFKKKAEAVIDEINENKNNLIETLENTRGGGPGGQHADKGSNKASIKLHIENSEYFEDLKESPELDKTFSNRSDRKLTSNQRNVYTLIKNAVINVFKRKEREKAQELQKDPNRFQDTPRNNAQKVIEARRRANKARREKENDKRRQSEKKRNRNNRDW
jgi:hypothetical protein